MKGTEKATNLLGSEQDKDLTTTESLTGIKQAIHFICHTLQHKCRSKEKEVVLRLYPHGLNHYMAKGSCVLTISVVPKTLNSPPCCATIIIPLNESFAALPRHASKELFVSHHQ